MLGVSSEFFIATIFSEARINCT